MTTVNTKTTLDTMFKNTVADKVNDLIPEGTYLLKMLPDLGEAEKVTRGYKKPVALTLESGFTYGDGSAFTLNDAVAGVYEEIEINSDPVILRSQISQSAANRMVDKPNTFVSWAYLRTKNMKKSISKRAELAMWYGKTGLGKVGSTTTAGTGTEVLTISDATWAPGIWGGLMGARVELRDGATGRAGHTTNILYVSKVDHANKAVTVVGDVTELAATAATNDIYFRGAYTNSMYGIDAQLSNTGTMFGIDASSYDLWKPNSYAVGGAITFAKVLEAAGQGVGKGLEGKANVFISNKAFRTLNTDIAALRMTDSSYDSSKFENGTDKITYHGDTGPLVINPVPHIKEGEGFIIPESEMERLGAQDITFKTNGPDSDEFFLPLASSAGYELRAQYDFAILIETPGQCTKMTGITY